MIIAIILTILAATLWGTTNYIDKYLLVGIDKGQDNVKVLLVFSTLITGIMLTPLWLILGGFNVNISLISLLSAIMSAVIYIIATVFFLKAMKENDASVIAVMLELIPVFSYILALILFKETLTIRQIIGSIIIMISAVIISVNFKEKNNTKKFRALILMTISAFLDAVYYIFFDIAIRNSSYYTCAFWYQIGFLIMGLILLCISSYRVPFVNAIKKNGKKYFGLNAINEVLNLGASLLANLANVMIPIAIVTVFTTGFQGMIVFIMGILGTLFFPKYIKEDISKPAAIKKIICIIIGFIGLLILAC